MDAMPLDCVAVVVRLLGVRSALTLRRVSRAWEARFAAFAERCAAVGEVLGTRPDEWYLVVSWNVRFFLQGRDQCDAGDPVALTRKAHLALLCGWDVDLVAGAAAGLGAHAVLLALRGARAWHAGAARRALLDAAENGQLALLRRLAQDPWNLSGPDARANNNAALRAAAERGHVDIIEELGRPPWSLGGADARAAGALAKVAGKGLCDLVTMLGQPPWGMSPADARAEAREALRMAKWHGHSDVARLLTGPPWDLTAEDVRSVEVWAQRGRRLHGPP